MNFLLQPIEDAERGRQCSKLWNLEPWKSIILPPSSHHGTHGGNSKVSSNPNSPRTEKSSQRACLSSRFPRPTSPATYTLAIPLLELSKMLSRDGSIPSLSLLILQESNVGQDCVVPSWLRSCRNRNSNGRRETSCQRSRSNPTRSRPESIRRSRLGLEGEVFNPAKPRTHLNGTETDIPDTMQRSNLNSNVSAVPWIGLAKPSP